MSRKEGTEKTIKPTEKTHIKSNLTVEEDARRQGLLRSLIYSKKTDSIDFKRPAELLHLIVYSKIENRELVEEDMKQLRVELDRVADLIGEIIAKSRRKTPNNTPQ